MALKKIISNGTLVRDENGNWTLWAWTENKVSTISVGLGKLPSLETAIDNYSLEMTENDEPSVTS